MAASSKSGPPPLPLPPDSPLRSLSGTTLVVLLRSFGCTFCREAMADVAAARAEIERSGANVAFIHGATVSEAAPWFRKYGLADVIAISDPGLEHYKAFGLGRTPVSAMIDPQVWTRGAACALQHGFGVQTLAMMRQLPGVFLVQRERVVAEFRHRTGADRPDYLALVRSIRP